MRQLLLLILIGLSPVAVMGQTKTKGILLEDFTWVEAEKILSDKTVVGVKPSECVLS